MTRLSRVGTSIAMVLAILALSACASSPPPRAGETRVVLDREAYFPATAGDLASLAPGSYRVDRGSGDSLRLTPASGADGIDLLARRTAHGTDLDSPRAALLRESHEIRRVVLLLPEQRCLEAWGSTENVRTRGASGITGSVKLQFEEQVNQRDGVRQELSEQLAQLKTLMAAVTQMSHQALSMMREREQLKAALQDAQQTLASIRDDPAAGPVIEKLEEQRERIRDSIEKLESEIENQEREIRETEVAIEQCQARIAALQGEIADLDRQIMILARTGLR